MLSFPLLLLFTTCLFSPFVSAVNFLTQVASGKCKDISGRNSLPTQDACEKASRQWNYGGVGHTTTDTSSYKPQGCYYFDSYYYENYVVWAPNFSGECTGKRLCLCMTTCPLGSFGSYEKISCTDCPPGKYGKTTGISASAVCETCTAGQFAAAASTSCANCLGGQYADNDGAGSCKKCVAGRFSAAVAAESVSTCVKCSVGRYSGLEAQTECLPCQVGMSNNVAGLLSCTVCAIGKYTDQTSETKCKDCPEGRFNAKDQSAASNHEALLNCESCAVGTFQSSPGQTACDSCPPGRYASESLAVECTLCIAGKASSATKATVSSTCVLCSAGTYAARDGQPSCTPCIAGLYGNQTGRTSSVGTCFECKAGTYASSAGATGCLDCSIGFYLSNSLKPSVRCFECTTALTIKATSCAGCAAGQYGDVATGCFECAIGFFSPGGNAASCKVCPAGWHGNNDTLQARCMICATGYFSSKIGHEATSAAICNACPAGTFSISAAATTESNCQNCPKGTYNVNVGAGHPSLCLGCEIGRYGKLEARTTPCTACDPGKYQKQPASFTECSMCPQGWVQSNYSAARCEMCLPGTAQLDAGKSQCPVCSTGKFASSPKSVSCIDCGNGFYQSEQGSPLCMGCIPGRTATSPGMSACSICSKGKYQDEIAAQVSCNSCPEGYYQSSEGQASCLECESGTMQNDVGRDSCNVCPTNFFNPEKNASLCHACPNGWTSSSRSAQCYKCPAGKAKTPCLDCNAGMFRSTQDLPTDCLDCPAGFAQFVNGQGACLPCIPGKYAEAGSTICTGCTSGFFRDATQNAGLPCVACPAGWIQQANESQACNECSPGKYQGSEGEFSCLDCLVDQVAKEPGGIACLDCPLGYFTNQRKSSTTCSDCPAGTAGLGCRICQAGKYRGTSDDLSKCLDCNAGFFAFSSGAPFCLDCDAGQYMAENGAVNCLSCLPGFYNPDKRSINKCKRCMKEEEVANELGTSCEPRAEDPDAATVALTSLRIASTDGKYIEITFTLTHTALPLTKSLTTIEAGDRLELKISPRTDFKTDTTYMLYSLEANTDKSPVDVVLLVDPISASEIMIENRLEQITGLGSAWEIQRYYQAKVIKSDAGGKGRRGFSSTRNDAWSVAASCGDELYLRTHPEDDLTQDPLLLFGDAQGTSCLPCPIGANCRGARTWAQVQSLPGYRPLPWDDRGYGKCPRPLACPGVEENFLPPESTYDLNGGNSTRVEASCHASHQSMFCSECNHFFDTKLGDQLGLCVPCPDPGQNLWRLVGLMVVGVAMMSFLVRDTLKGVKHIVDGIANGKDTAMPFHSIGIRIISSFMQVAGLLNNFRLELPAAVTTLFTAQSAVAGVGGAVISFNCLMPETRGTELFMLRLIVIVIVIPFIAMVCVILFWFANHLCCHKEKEGIQTVHGHIFQHARPKDKVLGSLVVLYYLMFPSILSGITSAMSCTTYGDKTKEGMSRILLDGSLSIECYKNVHLTLLGSILVPSFIVFTCIVPVTVVLAMRAHYKNESLLPHQKNFNPIACYRYGFLFMGYEQEFYGWEVLVMMRKSSFVVTSGLLRPYGPVAQVVGAATILILSLSIHLQFRPYDSQGHDRMESVSLHASLLILMMVLLASIVGRNIVGKLGPTSSVVLIIIVFGSSLFFFCIAVREVMKHSHENQHVLGFLARRFSKAAKMDRRHTLQLGDGTSVTLRSHKKFNALIKKATINAEASAVLQQFEEEHQEHKKAIQQKGVASKARLSKRLETRKSVVQNATTGDAAKSNGSLAALPRKGPKLDVKNWQVEPMNSATEVENVKGGPSEGESNRGKSNLVEIKVTEGTPGIAGNRAGATKVMPLASHARDLRTDVDRVRATLKMKIKTEARLNAVFKKLDVDGSNSMSKAEFVRLVCAVLKSAPKQELLVALWRSACAMDAGGEVNTELSVLMLREWLLGEQ